MEGKRRAWRKKVAGGCSSATRRNTVVYVGGSVVYVGGRNQLEEFAGVVCVWRRRS